MVFVGKYKIGNLLGFVSVILSIVPLSFILIPTASHPNDLIGLLGLGGSLVTALVAGCMGSRWWFLSLLW
jgi:hypothetical protein